jgi:hypothetical protein
MATHTLSFFRYSPGKWQLVEADGADIAPKGAGEMLVKPG